MTRPRIKVQVKDLPRRMQDYLATLPESTRNNSAVALRRLVEVADTHGLKRCVSEESIAALQYYFEVNNTVQGSIDGALVKIRKYAEATGDGLEWARNSRRKHRITSSLDDLSEKMRQALDDMETGRQSKLGALKPNQLRGVRTALLGLVEAADQAGLGRALNEDTVDAYVYALRARGATPKSIEYYKSCLRTYAAYSGEGVRWAEESRGVDTRPMKDVLAARRWDRWRPRALHLLQDGVRKSEIRLVDRFLALPRNSGRVTEKDLGNLIDGSESRGQKLFWVLKKLCPENPELLILRRQLASMRPGTPSKQRGRKPTISVLLEDLPEEMREKLAELRAAYTADGPRYAPETIDNMETAVRQLVFSARSRGLPEEISQETVSAWIDDLDARDIRATSKKGYMHALLLFAERAAVADPLVRLIAEDRAIYHSHGLGWRKRKVDRLSQYPTTITDVISAAASWRRRARSMPVAARDDMRRRMWFGSAILAILSVRQIRAKDLRHLVVDVSVIRERDHWRFDFKTFKTDQEFDGPLPKLLIPYLDDVILQGAVCDSNRDFWAQYNRRSGLPLFSNPNGKPFSHTWLYGICIEAFSHGPHAARMFKYEHVALLGDAGKESAKQTVGHASDEAAQHYEVEAEQRRRASVDDVLARELDALRRSA